ncbi:MAG: hydrogenase maturation nickel metallochaperone HypA [Lachnospiraceae bacterium]|jgi:hydrogenase nickel incorporation protein HypA/HybF|nr:hydrogenase maturation nickel metallochaperone HypA [Lachnospiraceae bacterium]MCI1726519.1 hydrogenase maturation nickel metallochaperone HypA [Lachnospiraceae bacterium]
MHELGLTMDMLKIVNEAAEKNGAAKIGSIRVRIGAYSGVVPELIEECFGPASRGTAAEGAKLFFEAVPVSVECRDCGRTEVLREHEFTCPVCGSDNIRIVSGREFYIESIEVN